MRKEFSRRVIVLSFIMSFLFYFLIFWEYLCRRFSRSVFEFSIVFSIGGGIFILWTLANKKQMPLRKMILPTLLVPYILSIVGNIGVALINVVRIGKLNGSILEYIWISAFFPYLAMRGWWLSVIFIIFLFVTGRIYKLLTS
jgi:hypothetical protein